MTEFYEEFTKYITKTVILRFLNLDAHVDFQTRMGDHPHPFLCAAGANSVSVSFQLSMQ